MFSFYSFFCAIAWFNISLFVIAYLSHKTAFLVKYSTSIVLGMFVLALLRIFLPLDFSFTYVISSYCVLSFFRDIVHAPMPLSSGFTVGNTIILVWILGSLFVLCRLIGTYLIQQKKLRAIKTQKQAQVQAVFEKLNLSKAEIVVSENIEVPMMTGILKAKIYLPRLSLKDSDWEYIIQHEYQHFLSHDIAIKLFYLVLKAVFWWNPAVYWFQKELSSLLELRCDARLVQRLTENEKEDYLLSLLSVAKQLPVRESYAVGTAAFAGAQTGAEIKQRFEFVLCDNKPKIFAQRIALIFVLLLFLLSYLFIVQPAGFPSKEESEGGHFITPENAYILVNKQGKMEIYADNTLVLYLNEDLLGEKPFSELKIIQEE